RPLLARPAPGPGRLQFRETLRHRFPGPGTPRRWDAARPAVIIAGVARRPEGRGMRRWGGARAALAVLLVLGPAADAAGDARPAAGLPGESRAAAARLADARRLLGRKQWTEAVTELQNGLDAAG